MVAIDRQIDIRIAVPADGPKLALAIKRIDDETDYLGEPGEALPWAERAEDYLRELAEKGSGVYLVALDGTDIVGFLGAFTGWFARNRGVIYIAHVGLRTAYRGQGLGGGLFEALESWGRARGAHRLELQVAEDNRRAWALYRRQGFDSEGGMVDAFRGNGRSYVCHLMGKLLVTGQPTFFASAPIASPPRAVFDTFTIRKLTADDWRALAVWEDAFLRDTPFLLKAPSEISPPERFARQIAEAVADPLHFLAAVTVAEDGAERIVGYATVAVEPFSRMAHMGFVFVGVLPAYRRRGIGSRLAEATEAWAREHGLGRLTAFALAANLPAQDFAASVGYQQEVRQRGYAIIDGEAADRIRFGKAVAGSEGRG